MADAGLATRAPSAEGAVNMEQDASVAQRASPTGSQVETRISPSAETEEAQRETRKSRGPNPAADYKMHFTRQKKRFDAATQEQDVRKKELTRASLKQLKLVEELEFLCDAVAGEIHRKKLIQGGRVDLVTGMEKGSLKTTERGAKGSRNGRHAANGKTARGAKDKTAHQLSSRERDVGDDAASSSSLDDDELLALAEEDDADSAADAGITQKLAAKQGPRASSKRQRSPSKGDTDDELLEAAGLSSPVSKKARRDS
jgi:hypothetical protein